MSNTPHKSHGPHCCPLRIAGRHTACLIDVGGGTTHGDGVGFAEHGAPCWPTGATDTQRNGSSGCAPFSLWLGIMLVRDPRSGCIRSP